MSYVLVSKILAVLRHPEPGAGGARLPLLPPPPDNFRSRRSVGLRPLLVIPRERILAKEPSLLSESYNLRHHLDNQTCKTADVEYDEHQSIGEETEDDGESKVSDSEEDDDKSVKHSWSALVREATDRHQEEFEGQMENYLHEGESEESAAVKAHNSMLPVYRKELKKVLLEKLELMHTLKKDPYFRKIMKTRQELMDTDD
ncbi:uncharacterized protein LOC116305604 [Actinia tenebrosa]|uniref:Uncharacterized protein LOC116305604 n=1 Tax=Actinia tenebrosa TaxID=6105 RepID=A0A6P8J0E3_ACTTE|nr:uncharacterized protein LOC116305604 [Actinia tenebrosa]